VPTSDQVGSSRAVTVCKEEKVTAQNPNWMITYRIFTGPVDVRSACGERPIPIATSNVSET